MQNKCPTSHPYFCPTWTNFGLKNATIPCVSEQNACFYDPEVYQLKRPGMEPWSRECREDAEGTGQLCDDGISRIRNRTVEDWVVYHSLYMEKSRGEVLRVVRPLAEATPRVAELLATRCGIDVSTWNIIDTERDGTCLLHAILMCLSSTYRKLSSGPGGDRRKIGELFRRYIIALIRDDLLTGKLKHYLRELVSIEYGAAGYLTDLVAFLLLPILGVNIIIISDLQITTAHFRIELPTIFIHQMGAHYEMIHIPGSFIGQVNVELNTKLMSSIGTEAQLFEGTRYIHDLTPAIDGLPDIDVADNIYALDDPIKLFSAHDEIDQQFYEIHGRYPKNRTEKLIFTREREIAKLQETLHKLKSKKGVKTCRNKRHILSKKKRSSRKRK